MSLLASILDQAVAFHVLIHVKVSMRIDPYSVSPVTPTSIKRAVPAGDDITIDAQYTHEAV